MKHKIKAFRRNMKNQRMNERTRRQGKSKAEQQQQQQQKAIFTNRKVWN